LARLRQLCSNEFLDSLADWNLILQDTSLASQTGQKLVSNGGDDGDDADDDQEAANDDDRRAKRPVNRITQRRQRL
jgi:hypothetical protein